MSQPAPTQQRKPGWRPRRVLAAVGLVLLAVIAAAVIFRQDLATRGAVAYLEGQGVAVRSLTVTRLSPSAIEVRELDLGDAGEVTAQRVQLTPAFEGFSVSLRDVAVDGLRLRLDITGEAPMLGSLQPVLDRLTAEEDSDKADAAAIPPLVTLTDAKVIIETPSGPMAADLSGGLSTAGAGDILADFSLRLDSDLGRLQAKLTGRRTIDGVLSLEAGIDEGRLAWRGFAVGAFAGRLSLTHSQAAGPRLNADLDLTDLSYLPAEGTSLQLARGRLSAKGGLTDAALSLQLDGAQEALTLEVKAKTTPDADRRRVDFSIQSEARSAGGLTQFLHLPGGKVTAGTAVLEAKGSGSLADGGEIPRSWPEMLNLLPGSRLKLDGDASLAGVALADGSQGISAHLPLVVELAEDRLQLSLREDAEVRIERPTPARLRNLGVPDDLLPLTTSGLTLTLKAGGDLPFLVTATPAWPPRSAEIAMTALAASDQGLRLAAKSEGSAAFGEDLALAGLNGSVDSRAEAKRLALGGREANGVAVTLPLSVDYGGDGLRLTLSRSGQLRVQQFGAGAPLRLETPLVFAVTEMNLEAAADASGYRYRLAAEEDGAELRISRADAEAIAVQAGALALRLEGRFDRDAGHDAALKAGLSGLDLPDYAFSAQAASIDVRLDRELRPATSSFAFGPLQVGDGEPMTGSLLLNGDLKRAGGGYDITAELGLTDGPALADIAARYGDDGRARVEAVSKALTFSPEGLQPAQISPLLGALEKVRGSVTATAGFVWPQDPARESGRVTISDLSFGGPAGEVEGLNLDLALNSLLPLASAPSQSLKVRSLDPGVPVDAIELVFSLDQAPRPHLSLESGGFGLGGARWRIDPAVFDPAAPSNRIVLATDALDLATFFELIGVDGLSGSGTLKGSLPIVFQGEDVIVDEGRFEALAPGRLSIRFEALRSALAGGGETVELAVKALEDFHYDDLSVTLAKTAANDATVRLSTLGQNPEVLEGQPFRFNINLESNLTSVLEALRQGYSLSDDALRRAWRLHE